jgi:transcriptional regulator with XRE-family HTH domain
MAAVDQARRLPPPELGPMLSDARERAGLGLREAARRAGIRHGYLRDLEGARRTPSSAVAAALADVLGLGESERARLTEAALDGIGYARPGRVRVLEPGRPRVG